jgi:membrane protease YdiL (CAAX protease family)
MRRYPLVSFFLLAFGFSWAYELTVFRVLFTPGSPWEPLLTLGYTVGPALAAFLMTASTLGQAGIRKLLRRYVLWHVGLPWYLVVLLGVPALLLIAVLLLPGALAAFRLPGPSFLPTYLVGYLVFVLFHLLGEEPGWRGFALPRLEPRAGPLVGTLLLGGLWGLWHLPLFFIPGTAQYPLGPDTGVVGHLVGFGGFVILFTALAVVITWVFNNTRGSLLLAILFHTSFNYAWVLLIYPELMVLPGLGLTLDFLGDWRLVLVWVAVAGFLIAATGGRLSYPRYQRDAGQ